MTTPEERIKKAEAELAAARQQLEYAKAGWEAKPNQPGYYEYRSNVSGITTRMLVCRSYIGDELFYVHSCGFLSPLPRQGKFRRLHNTFEAFKMLEDAETRLP